MKKVVIVSSSPRKNGNSEILALECKRGALEQGHEVKEIYVRDLNMQFCKGCLSCINTQTCIIQDDIKKVIDSVKEADVLVFSTPVYYYSVSGQLKTFLDRLNPLYESEYQFRDVYLIATAAEDEKEAIFGAKTAVQGWVDCFEKAIFKDTIYGIGCTKPGDVKSKPDMLTQAYEMGCRL